jgi:hypothetical protein
MIVLANSQLCHFGDACKFIKYSPVNHEFQEVPVGVTHIDARARADAPVRSIACSRQQPRGGAHNTVWLDGSGRKPDIVDPNEDDDIKAAGKLKTSRSSASCAGGAATTRWRYSRCFKPRDATAQIFVALMGALRTSPRGGLLIFWFR